jgi:hypothetical protein
VLPAGLAVLTAVAAALLAQLILVQAGLAQLPALIARGTASLTRLAVASAVAFAPLAQFTLVLAGSPELLTLAATPTAAANTNTTWADLDPL